MKKRLSAAALVMALTLGTTAGLALAGETDTFQAGDQVSGFTLERVDESTLLTAQVYTFHHEHSGADLVWVSNEDPEMAFSITFRTPYVDETDTNHVFEHSILASSEKYPAKDIFFDMANKAFSTFINASTYPTMTTYPVASTSEEQLLKMMDVYMSCMDAPGILSDERFFDREALRYELTDPEGEISLTGTVFAEDSGFLTDVSGENQAQVLDALYPEEIASNSIGRAHMNYENLTYEHTLETYERCYHYDNSIIILYGDLDIERFLAFLDEEYLSRQEAFGTDLSAWEDPLTEEGYVEEVLPVPAYEGDTVENNSVITYAVDLQGATDEELVAWDILTSALNMVGSPLYNLRMMNQVDSPITAGVSVFTAKPYLSFTMSYANEGQAALLKDMIDQSLTQVAQEGIAPELLEIILKSLELNSMLLRDNANVGINIMPQILSQWSRSGNTGYYITLEDTLNALIEDEEQTQIRAMAEAVLQPRRSALITSVPTPGLAEEHDAQLAQYLTDMKDAMTPEQIDELVERTSAFAQWNEEEIPNNSFLITPDQLPDPEEYTSYTVDEKEGITLYTGTASVEDVGSYRLYFDLTGLSREEMEYLMLTSNYRMQMDTASYSAYELNLLAGQYLSNLEIQLCYPNEGAGEYHRPMMRVAWKGLTEDFEESLDLILELLRETDYSYADMLSYLTVMYADAWDMARQDGYTIANYYARTGGGMQADTNRLEMDVDGQELYYMMSDLAQKLQTQEGFAEEYAQILTDVSQKAYTKDNLIFLSVTGPEDAQVISEKAADILSQLPQREGELYEYELPEYAQKMAVCVEDSMNNTILVGDYNKDADFKGSYIPFIYALNDKYTVPLFRFSLGAYSAGSYHTGTAGTITSYTYSDPNIGDTIEALYGMAQVLPSLELTQEELNGYVLTAYSNATYPLGIMNEVMNVMAMDVMGADYDRWIQTAKEIRDCDLSLLADASEHIGQIIEDSTLCTAGNETAVRGQAEYFDEIIPFHLEETAGEPAEEPENGTEEMSEAISEEIPEALSEEMSEAVSEEVEEVLSEALDEAA